MQKVRKTSRLHNCVRKGPNTFVAASSEPENSRHLHRVLPEETVDNEKHQRALRAHEPISL